MRPEDVPEGPLLVDTDVVSYWTLNSDLGEPFRPLSAGRELAVSFATYGELLSNAYAVRWREKRINDLRDRLKTFVIVPYTARAVELWAQMHPKLKGQLHQGGTNDLWTAACALAMDPNLPIMTNNLKDFRAIAALFPDLRLVHPTL